MVVTFNSFLDHLFSFFYKMHLGSVGNGTVIRYGCSLDGDRLKDVRIGKKVNIDRNCTIGARSRIIGGEKLNPVLSIGDNCCIGRYTHITAINKVIIGDNLLTGGFVLITDNSHGLFQYEMLKKPPLKRPVESKGEVVIGKNVWIGDKASILSGVHIGDGCIIAANAVVTHDIPSYSLAAGVPAKVIKTFSKF